MSKLICVFGASIERGAWDSQGGWVERLKNYILSKDLDIELYNLGIDGDNSNDILRRFEFETKQRIKNWTKEIVIIYSDCSNDAALLKTKNELMVPEKTFKENLENFIKKAKNITNKIVFIESPKVNESKTMPVPWENDLYYKNKNIIKYNQIMKNACTKNSLEFIEMFNLLEKKDLDDGLHPNSKGHEKMFQKIKDFLIKKEII